MLKMIAYLGFGGTVFALAAAGSWYLQNMQATQQAAPTTGASTMPAPNASPAEQSMPAAAQEDNELPVPVRPRPMSAEEVFRYAASIRTRKGMLKQREETLKKDEVRLQLVFDDIRTEQRELEGLQAEVEGKITAAQDLLNRIIQERQKSAQAKLNAQQELDDFKKAQTEYEDLEIQNVKKMSTWFQSMEPEKSAELLRELANDGKISMAVKLLANFEEREATKILEAIDDPALVVQLAEKFRLLKNPATDKKKKKR